MFWIRSFPTATAVLVNASARSRRELPSCGHLSFFCEASARQVEVDHVRDQLEVARAHATIKRLAWFAWSRAYTAGFDMRVQHQVALRSFELVFALVVRRWRGSRRRWRIHLVGRRIAARGEREGGRQGGCATSFGRLRAARYASDVYQPDRSPPWALLVILEMIGWGLVYGLKDTLWPAILLGVLMVVITVMAWRWKQRG
jgi:hypothetical protein